MITDLNLLGVVTADLMTHLEEEEFPEGATVEEVFVIAAVTWPVKNGIGHSVSYRSSTARPWVQKGLLGQARSAVDRSGRPYDESEDEPE